MNTDGTSQPSCEELSRLARLESFATIGPKWAHTSSAEALTLACQPSLMTAQTFECLTIYWFAVEDTRRADIHSGKYADQFQSTFATSVETVVLTLLALAYRTCCMLGYNKTSGSIATEPERRCFWACWASMCIAGEPKAYLRSAWLEVAGLSLPASSSDSEVAEMMDQGWHCSVAGITSTNLERPSCLFAEMMKVLGIWQVPFVRNNILVKSRLTM